MTKINGNVIDGDLAVGRNTTIGGNFTSQGNSHVKGNLRVDGWLHADNVRVYNKGLYMTLQELKAEYPYPMNGWWAVVGNSVPGQVYTGKNGQWVPTGGNGGEVDPLLQAEEVSNPEGLVGKINKLTKLNQQIFPVTILDAIVDSKTNQTLEHIINEINVSVDHLDSKVFPLSLEVTGGGVFEKGTTQIIVLSWVLKKGGSVITADSIKIDGNPVVGEEKIFRDVKTNTSYKVEATKGSKTILSTAKVTFVNPSYLGVVSNSFAASESTIKALGKSISEYKNRTLSNANLVNQKVCYAYPKAFGALTSIKDANNFDYINSYQRTELTVNGETYYVYILKDATSITGFKQVFT